MKEIDLYLDLSTTYLNDVKYTTAVVSPTKLITGFDRFRVTVRLPDEYFESKVTGTIIADVKNVTQDE